MENYSKQREEIIEVIKNSHNHPNAEDIYILVKQKDSAISRSTVYRNLRFLFKKGIINQIALSDGPDRYEYVDVCQKHGHVVCSKCGKLCNFNCNLNVETIKQDILKQTGIEIFDNGIVIKGICNSCKDSKKLI